MYVWGIFVYVKCLLDFRPVCVVRFSSNRLHYTKTDLYLHSHIPSKQGTLTQCWLNIGSTSATPAQHKVNTVECLMCLLGGARHIYSLFDQCWSNVYDVGPTLVKHSADILCLLGRPTIVLIGADLRKAPVYTANWEPKTAFN